MTIKMSIEERKKYVAYLQDYIYDHNNYEKVETENYAEEEEDNKKFMDEHCFYPEIYAVLDWGDINVLSAYMATWDTAKTLSAGLDTIYRLNDCASLGMCAFRVVWEYQENKKLLDEQKANSEQKPNKMKKYEKDFTDEARVFAEAYAYGMINQAFNEDPILEDFTLNIFDSSKIVIYDNSNKVRAIEITMDICSAKDPTYEICDYHDDDIRAEWEGIAERIVHNWVLCDVLRYALRFVEHIEVFTSKKENDETARD